MCGVGFLLFVYAEEDGMRRQRANAARQRPLRPRSFHVNTAHNIRDAPTAAAAAVSRLSDKNCYYFLPLSC